MPDLMKVNRSVRGEETGTAFLEANFTWEEKTLVTKDSKGGGTLPRRKAIGGRVGEELFEVRFGHKQRKKEGQKIGRTGASSMPFRMRGKFKGGDSRITGC